jgi:hypothetical protein
LAGGNRILTAVDHEGNAICDVRGGSDGWRVLTGQWTRDAVKAHRNGQFFHGAQPELWKKAKEEGILWGIDRGRFAPTAVDGRHTWMSPHPETAMGFGSVLLQVNYRPVGTPVDSYRCDPAAWRWCSRHGKYYGWTPGSFYTTVPVPIADVLVVDGSPWEMHPTREAAVRSYLAWAADLDECLVKPPAIG